MKTSLICLIYVTHYARRVIASRRQIVQILIWRVIEKVDVILNPAKFYTLNPIALWYWFC